MFKNYRELSIYLVERLEAWLEEFTNTVDGAKFKKTGRWGLNNEGAYAKCVANLQYWKDKLNSYDKGDTAKLNFVEAMSVCYLPFVMLPNISNYEFSVLPGSYTSLGSEDEGDSMFLLFSDVQKFLDVYAHPNNAPVYLADAGLDKRQFIDLLKSNKDIASGKIKVVSHINYYVDYLLAEDSQTGDIFLVYGEHDADKNILIKFELIAPCFSDFILIYYTIFLKLFEIKPVDNFEMFYGIIQDCFKDLDIPYEKYSDVWIRQVCQNRCDSGSYYGVSLRSWTEDYRTWTDFYYYVVKLNFDIHGGEEERPSNLINPTDGDNLNGYLIKSITAQSQVLARLNLGILAKCSLNGASFWWVYDPKGEYVLSEDTFSSWQEAYDAAIAKFGGV